MRQLTPHELVDQQLALINMKIGPLNGHMEGYAYLTECLDRVWGEIKSPVIMRGRLEVYVAELAAMSLHFMQCITRGGEEELIEKILSKHPFLEQRGDSEQ